MSKMNYLKNIAIFMSLLVISMPIVFSDNMHLVVNKNGALVTGDGYYREYNEYNQLIKIYNGSTNNPVQLLQEYFYHPIQEKIAVKKTYENGTWKETIYYVNDNYIEIENSSGIFSEKYLYIDGQLVAQVDTNGNKFSVHGDHLGSVSMIVNASGDVVETSFYDPYGSILEGGSKSRFDYEGKEFDNVVQDRDFGFRKQNGKLPYLWNKPDTLLPNVYDPQSLNRYSFELNNPYKQKEEDGHIAVLPFIVAGVIVGTINTIEYAMTHENRNAYDAAGYFAAGFVEGALALINPLGAVAGGGISKVIENKIDNRDLTEGVLEEAAISGIAAGLYEYFGLFPKTKEWLIKKPLSYITTKTGLTFTGNILSQEVASRGGYYLGNNLRIANQNAAQNANQIIAQMRGEGNSKAVFGGGGGRSGYSSKLGGYVTKDGRFYPTKNKNFVPKKNVPRVCVSGCKKK